MRTRVSEMLGVEFPILAFSHCRDVVAAVSNAGGFGVLGAVAHTPEQLEIDLGWIEDQTHGRPYGVDLLLPAKYAGADEGGLDREAVRRLLPAEQQRFVDDILDRYGVPPLPPTRGDGREWRGYGSARRDTARSSTSPSPIGSASWPAPSALPRPSSSTGLVGRAFESPPSPGASFTLSATRPPASI